MPALAAKVGVEELLALNHAIVASVTPDEMRRAAPLMLGAMNVEDRVELLGGAQAGAPPEVFAGMLGLTRSVISPADYAQVAARLGVD